MSEKCEHTWPGIFGSHYCGLTDPHDIHVCGEPACAVQDHTGDA
jgi:hypothetical protein